MQSRLEANLPGASTASGGFGGGQLPPAVVDGFSAAMSQTLLLPAAVMLIAIVAVLFLRRTRSGATADWEESTGRAAHRPAGAHTP
jgi:fucose permease